MPLLGERASAPVLVTDARMQRGKEILAQECGRTFESLWDSLNVATNKLSFAASFPVGEIVLGKWNPPQTLPHEIELREPAGPGGARTLSHARRISFSRS